MDTSKPLPHADKLLAHAAGIVSAYVGNNRIGREALAGLIAEVHAALAGTKDSSSSSKQAEAGPPTPAVPVKKSVFADHIVCLECGKHQKSLKRHLRAAHDLTPDAYRARFGLPRDYPMVATEYRARRSELARSIGLGRRPVTEEAGATAQPAKPAPEATPTPEAAQATNSPKRRRSKANEAAPSRAKSPRRRSKPATG